MHALKISEVGHDGKLTLRKPASRMLQDFKVFLYFLFVGVPPNETDRG